MSDETIVLTAEDIHAARQEILDRHGLQPEDLEAAECGCCPKRLDVPWSAFDGWRTWGWLLGE